MKRKLYKLLSIVLSVCILLSVCGVANLLNTTADTKITDYYVGYSTTSDGSGTSVENPVPSVYAAIEKINANGLTAGDTANIWIVQDIAKPEKVASGVANKPYHNLAYWSPNADSKVPTHEAKIVIKPHEDNQKVNTSLETTYLSMGKQIADQGLIILGGPTEIENLKIVYTSSSNSGRDGVTASTGQSHIIANGYDLTIGNGISYCYINHNGLNGDNWNGSFVEIPSLGVSLAVEGGTFDKPMYLGLKTPWNPHDNAVEIPSLDNMTANQYTFKEDVTVEVENPEIYNGYIRIGSYSGGSSTFEKNLNFKLGNIGQIRFKTGTQKAIIKGGVQFIAKSTLSFDDGYDYTDVTAWVKEDGSTLADIWYLKVAAADLGYINFMNGQTGKFKVIAGMQATATPAAGGEPVVSENGVLDLSGKPGVYTLAFEAVAITTFDYYVGFGGVAYSETDEYGVVGTVDAPYATIEDAIKALKANGAADAEGNTANIYIVQDIASPAKVASGVANKPYHNLAYWCNDPSGVVPEHNAKLVIQPYSENQKVNTSLTTTYLVIGKQVADQAIIVLGGPTEFKNIKIVYTSSSNVERVSATEGKSHIIANGNNLVMGEGVTYGFIAHNGNNGDNWSGKITDIKTLGIALAQNGGTYEKPIYLGFENYWDAHNNALEIPSLDNRTANEYTFKEDVTVEVNNSNMYSGYIRVGSFSGGASTFEKNLNFKLTNINRIRFKNGVKNVVVKGGVQFIVPNKQAYDGGYGYTVITRFVKEDGTTPADLWYLNVEKANMDKISFISGVQGKYAIAEGYTATATPKAGGNAIVSENGVLNLMASAAEYTVTFEQTGGVIVPTNKNMLYFKSDNIGPFYQRVENLVPNATYTLKFALSNNVTDFKVVAQTNGIRSDIGAQIALANSTNKGRYTEYEYTITMPDEITVEGGSETGMAFIGVQIPKKEDQEGYIFDLSLKDSVGTEYFANGDFGGGFLDHWAWGWNKWFNSTAYGVSSGTFTHGTEGDVYLEIMKFDEGKMPNVGGVTPPPASDNKMLYFKATDIGPLQQRVDIEPGETYVYSFSLSNAVSGSNFQVTASHVDRRTNTIATGNKVSSDNKGKYTEYVYEITMPTNMTDINNQPTNTTFIGVRLNSSTTTYEAYFFNASFYKKSDANKTELLVNGKFENGFLDKWTWGYKDFRSGANLGLTEFTSDNDPNVTLKVMAFDESKMPVVEEPYEPSNNPKMLYFKGTKRGPFYQRLEDLTPGATYTFKFALSNNVSGFDIVAHRNSNRATLNLTKEAISAVDKGRYTEYEYSITLPAELTVEGGVETNMAFIGLKFDSSSVAEGGYITNLSLKDANGKEFFHNGDFFSGYLDYWAWDWNAWFNSNSYGKHKGTWSHGDGTNIYLEVMDFDESKMKDVEKPYIPTPGNNMLYFKGTKRGPLYQRLEDLKPNGTYIMSFDVSNNVTGVTPALAKNSSRGGLAFTSCTYVDGVDHGRYTTYTYEVVLPSELTVEGGVETYMAFIGVTFSQPSAEEGGFITNISLKEKINETTLSEELFENGDFYNGYLDKWCWEWNVWFNSLNYGQYKGTFTHSNQYGSSEIYLEVMKFDESKMPDVKAKLPDYSRKMIYFKNGAVTNYFAAWVDSAPGMKYILKYSVFATEEITPALNANGLRGRLGGNPRLLEEVKHENYTSYMYEITVPDNYTDSLVFLGVTMPYYAEGYLFDIESWRVDDPEMEDIWDNEGFVKGFDDWIWGWTVTWFSKEGTGNLTEWSDATHDIRLMKFDLSNIDKLVNDIYRNDGEWWTPEDVAEKEEPKGTANVSGTFKDHNGNAVAGLKLVFKSENNKYTATTDKNGAFSFKDIVEGYYELYFVNSEGKEVLSEFYSTLFDGDELTVNIVTDTTKEVKKGTLKGAVYTPQLKTVANIKLYLRGVAETTTDANGAFDFGEVPVGKYDLYTILEDGSEYIFRTVEVKENTDLAVKLKYDVGTSNQDVVDDIEDEEESFNWIWIIVACGAVVLVAAAVIIIVVAKKKKSQK